MTKPCYLQGCVAGSEEHRVASDSSYAFNVNLNNGNVNYNNRNNSGLVLACRRVSPRECESVQLRDLYNAYRSASKGKVPSVNQATFAAHWMDRVLELQRQLNAYAWQPSPSICFIATKPKAREIHAPDFADRVVHHWLVPQLEAVFEPMFIHDSYSNRADKGTHAAVHRVESFAREVHSGEGGGWFLQLDIKNFFNTIHRPTLWRELKRVMQRHGMPLVVQRATHALLRKSPVEQGVVYRATAAERMAVPAHKRLENAPPSCGLPIGNLSSQFFANVYLNKLDQFVKHKLKARRYVRYVDDFVIVHRDRAQLLEWKAQIEDFLRRELRLELKSDFKLSPLTVGIDFLGYIVRPTHTTVRRRVVAHAREKLSNWERHHIGAMGAVGTPADYRQLLSLWNSYRGHFQHARSRGLVADFQRRYPWLSPLVDVRRRFHNRQEGTKVRIAIRGLIP